MFWVASSKKDLLEVPEEVRDAFGYDLYLSQIADKHSHAKTLQGLGSVYVLHCFQKKSTKGIATPKPEMDKIRERLQWVQTHVGEKSK